MNTKTDKVPIGPTTAFTASNELISVHHGNQFTQIY